MTALVGPSGSGKSTIINLMMRLYDPQNGSVEINGTDLRDVSFASLREHVSYVGQETFLFPGRLSTTSPSVATMRQRKRSSLQPRPQMRMTSL